MNLYIDLLNFFNSWNAKPSEFSNFALNSIPNSFSLPSLVFRPIDSPIIHKLFFDGSYISKLQFFIISRSFSTSTVLSDFAKFLRNTATLPTLSSPLKPISFSQLSLPILIRSNPDGSDDTAAKFAFFYI